MGLLARKVSTGRFVPAPRLLLAAVFVAAGALAARPAAAQYTWNNPAGGNWSVAGNWTGGVPVPGATTSLTFGSAATQNATYTATNDIGAAGTPFDLTALTVNNTAGTVTLAGNPLNFTGATPTATIAGAGSLVVSAPVSLAASLTVGGTGTGGFTISGAVAGGTNNIAKTSSGAFTLSGGGTLNQLSVQNGSTSVTGGTLALTLADGSTTTAALQLGAASGQTVTTTISGGATVNVSDNTFVGDIAGSTGTLTVTGAGTVLNNGTAANAAATSGRLAVGNNGAGTLNVLAGAVVNTDRLFSSRFTTGSSAVLVDGTGSRIHVITQASIGSNGNGNLSIQNGGNFQADSIFNLGNNGVGQSSVVTVNGTGSLLSVGTTTIAANLAIGSNAASTGPFTVNVQNGGAVTVAGQLQLLNGASTFTVQSGGTVTSTGAVFVGSTSGAATVSVTGSGSVLTTPSAINIGGSGGTAGTGTGTLTVGNSGSVTATTGLIIYNTGTVNLTAGGLLSTGGLTDGSTTVTGGTVNLASGTTLNITSGAVGTYTGVIAGAGAVAVAGGTQTLAGTNTYSGGTTIIGGTLAVTNAAALGTGSIAVGGGATLGGTVTIAVPSGRTLSGAGTVSSAISVSGTLAPGGAPGGGTAVLTAGSGVAFAAGSTFSVKLNGNTPGSGAANHDQLLLSGVAPALTLGNTALSATLGYAPAAGDRLFVAVLTDPAGTVSGTFNGVAQNGVVTVGGYSAQVSYFGDSGTNALAGGNDIVLYNFTPVPESGWGLLACASAAGVVAWGRRSRGSLSALTRIAA